MPSRESNPIFCVALLPSDGFNQQVQRVRFNLLNSSESPRKRLINYRLLRIVCQTHFVSRSLSGSDAPEYLSETTSNGKMGLLLLLWTKVMDYILSKSNRKSISIRVTKDAILEVRAPKRMPQNSIELFLENNKEWITKHVNKALDANQKRESFSIGFGSTVMLRGQPFIIHKKKSPAEASSIAHSDKQILVNEQLNEIQILDSVRTLLKEYAKEYLPKRTAELAITMGVKPSSVRVGNANSRWGSCNSLGRINYTWKIIMCDDSIIDYVIVHELAHLRHMNHSQLFWNEVQRYSPEAKNYRKSLKEFQRKLNCETW